jgi:predicted metal-dependent HD superfamily phosphohydrolase
LTVVHGPVEEALLPLWRNLAANLDCDQEAADGAFDALMARYAEPHRHYHNSAHLQQMFTILDRLEPQRPQAVDLAVWYHDAVYDPRAQDNEEASARLARQELSQLHVPSEIVEETCRLILLTRSHEADDPSGRLLLDADLAILGEPEPIYSAYAAAIRQEYAWVPDDRYRQGRADVLRRFLARPYIYHTPLMRVSHEAAARRNLQREIEELASRGR